MTAPIRPTRSTQLRPTTPGGGSTPPTPTPSQPGGIVTLSDGFIGALSENVYSTTLAWPVVVFTP